MDRGYKLNLADMFTFLRIALAPLIIYLFYLERPIFMVTAILLFGVSALTDYLDGFFARIEGSTKFGKLMDSIADKILINSILGLFAINGMFSKTAFLIIIFRDLIILGLRNYANTKNKVIVANPIGKIKTVLQFILIFILMFGEIIGRTTGYDWFVLIATLIIVFVATYSLIEYLFDYHTPEKQGNELLIITNSKSRGNSIEWRKKLLFDFARTNKAKIVYRTFPLTSIDVLIGGYQKVIIAGGDGTFQSVLNDKIFNTKTLGFFPFGGGNANFSFFFQGRKWGFLKEKVNFYEKEFDVLELVLDDKKKIKTISASIGFDAEVLRRAKRKYSQGWIDYFQGIIKTIFFHSKKWEIGVSADGREFSGRFGNITLGKFPYYGYRIKAMPSGIKKNDGNVYGMLLGESGLKKIYKTALLTFFNIKDKSSSGIKNKKIVIESSEKMPVQSGGEFLGYYNKIEIKVVEKKKGMFG